jgi:dCTP deaminase
MILSDRDLFDFLDPGTFIGPASQDLHLGDSLLRLPYGVTLDPERDQSDLWQTVPLRDDGRWMLGRGDLYLAVTEEFVAVSREHVGLLHGLSSLGRLGLLVHVTAGLIDPGNALRPTLELVSLGGSILLRPGMRIAQITYHQLSSSAMHPYAGKYFGDSQPTPSRMYRERVREADHGG